MIRNKNIQAFNIQPRFDRKSNNFKVAAFSGLNPVEDILEEDHANEYFEIIWLKNGTGVHRIDLSDHPFNGSVIFFIAPGQMRKITNHKNLQGYVLKFLPSVFRQERDFMDYVFETCLLDTERTCPVISIPEQMNDVFQELFSRFTEEFNRQELGADLILSSYLKILTTHIRRIKNNNREAYINKPQYDLFRKFKVLIEHHYKTKHSVQEYATLLKTQPRSLNAAARKHGNKSALGIIQERIILEAKRRLTNDHKSVKELCYELGFEDPAYFTRFFKRIVGISPQHFKEGVGK
jgi:AraC-like DNA-binding protein